MGARLYCNVTASLTNFYLVYVLEYSTEDEIAKKTPIQVAIIPLLLYLSSVGASSTLNRLY
jgi:hypothetical protein